MASPVAITGSYKNITSTTTISTVPGQLLGIFVASASATPVITVVDAATAVSSPLIVNAFTPIGGTWYPIPGTYNTGLRVVISGTVDCTVFYSPTPTT